MKTLKLSADILNIPIEVLDRLQLFMTDNLVELELSTFKKMMEDFFLDVETKFQAFYQALNKIASGNATKEILLKLVAKLFEDNEDFKKITFIFKNINEFKKRIEIVVHEMIEILSHCGQFAFEYF